jgi:hypothetical protein
MVFGFTLENRSQFAPGELHRRCIGANQKCCWFAGTEVLWQHRHKPPQAKAARVLQNGCERLASSAAMVAARLSQRTFVILGKTG